MNGGLWLLVVLYGVIVTLLLLMVAWLSYRNKVFARGAKH